MTNADITTLINQERSRIVNKTHGKEVVLTITLKSGRVHKFATNEAGQFLADIAVLNEMLKIPILVSRTTFTSLNPETNQFQDTITSEYRYRYLTCENIDDMDFTFKTVDVNDVNVSNPNVSSE